VHSLGQQLAVDGSVGQQVGPQEVNDLGRLELSLNRRMRF
jgi:hypothetical protein